MTGAKAANLDELEEILKENFGDRIVTIVKPVDKDSVEQMLRDYGAISGSIDEEDYTISFDGEDLLVSSESNAALDKLLPVLTEVMGNKKPICKYTIIPAHGNRYETIEWDLNSPEERISDVVNGRGFDITELPSHVKLYNGKKARDYLDNPKDLLPEEKVWGVYNTFKPNFVENLCEIDLWYKIDQIGGMIFYSRHDYGRFGKEEEVPKDLLNKRLLEAQYNLECLVYATRKYGVEFEREPSTDKHIEKSDTYIAWYNFWYNHFRSMSVEEFNHFVDLKNAGEDVSEYLPKESWKDSYKKGEGK